MNEDEDKDSEAISLGSGKSYFCYGQGTWKNWIETDAELMKNFSSKLGQITKE